MSGWDETYLGNLDEERRKAVEALANQDKEVRRFFRETFLDTPAGRRVLVVLAGYCRLLATTYTGNAMSHFLEGRRDVVLFVLEMCGARDLKAVAAIMKTAIEIEEDLKNGSDS